MDDQRVCKYCGKKVEIENAIFCTGCGKRLDGSDEAKTGDEVKPRDEVKTEDDKKPVSILKVAAIAFASLLAVTAIGFGVFKAATSSVVEEQTDNNSDDEDIVSAAKPAEEVAEVKPTEEVAEAVPAQETQTTQPDDESETAQTAATAADADVPGNDLKDAEGIHTYKIVIDDVTWEEALRGAAGFEGGYLVHINSKEEFDYIIDFIDKSGYSDKIFWIGARRDDNPAIYKWADQKNGLVGGSLNASQFWLDGEPTFYDNDTSTFETCVEMFYSKKNQKWVFNDVQNDVLMLLPSYTGKMGYIVEID